MVVCYASAYGTYPATRTYTVLHDNLSTSGAIKIALAGISYHARISTLDEQLVQLLTQYPRFELAILFGSQATGQADEASDIDLALLADAPISSS